MREADASFKAPFRGREPMNTMEALTIAVSLGSVVAVVIETALKDPGAFGEIATDVEAFARRPAPVAKVPSHRRDLYVVGVVTTALLLVFFA
jgi:hypothetical protein